MRKLSSALLALCFTASALAAQGTLPDTAYTTAAVTLRAKPVPNARSVARLAAETPVHVVACENGLCQTAVNGRNGYLPTLPLRRAQRIVQRRIRLYKLERQPRPVADADARQSAAARRYGAVQGWDIQFQPIAPRHLLASRRCSAVALGPQHSECK